MAVVNESDFVVVHHPLYSPDLAQVMLACFLKYKVMYGERLLKVVLIETLSFKRKKAVKIISNINNVFEHRLLCVIMLRQGMTKEKNRGVWPLPWTEKLLMSLQIQCSRQL